MSQVLARLENIDPSPSCSIYIENEPKRVRGKFELRRVEPENLCSFGLRLFYTCNYIFMQKSTIVTQGFYMIK